MALNSMSMMKTRPVCSVVQRCSSKQKVLVVMGPTGTGKSRLAIQLATTFDGEIISADKMKVYKGFDVVTNKTTEEERHGVTHHLLGFLDHKTDFTAENFVPLARSAIESILERGKRPIISGGSISYIEALVDDHDNEFRSRYDACFLWIDVQMPVLRRVLYDRVDRMVATGMVEEVRILYNSEANYTKGIRQAIGVQELDSYFRAEYSSSTDEKSRKILLESAINEMKINTFKRAQRQLEKIHRLRDVKGWNIQGQ